MLKRMSRLGLRYRGIILVVHCEYEADTKQEILHVRDSRFAHSLYTAITLKIA
jgi:hypothetical protein